MHIHACWIGAALDAATAQLNASAPLKERLGAAPKKWRVSGCVQVVTRFWKSLEADAELSLGNPLDSYVVGGLRERDAPPGVVRVVTLA